MCEASESIMCGGGSGVPLQVRRCGARLGLARLGLARLGLAAACESRASSPCGAAPMAVTVVKRGRVLTAPGASRTLSRHGRPSQARRSATAPARGHGGVTVTVKTRSLRVTTPSLARACRCMDAAAAAIEKGGATIGNLDSELTCNAFKSGPPYEPVIRRPEFCRLLRSCRAVLASESRRHWKKFDQHGETGFASVVLFLGQ